MLKNRLYLFILFVLVLSCHPVEFLDEVVFDYEQFNKISINAKIKSANNLYESKYSDNYIDNSLLKPPAFYLNKWLDSNISIFGNENKFEINILESSLKKSEIKNNEQNKYKEKIIFLYEAKYLVQFILYDNDNLLLGSSIVEVNRSTTSGKFISIQENDKIINSLIYNSLIDFSNKAAELIKIHLKNYVL